MPRYPSSLTAEDQDVASVGSVSRPIAAMPPQPITAKILTVSTRDRWSPSLSLRVATTCFTPTPYLGCRFLRGPRDASRLGANVTVEWANANLERIHIAPTDAFVA
jgi:hypothetical protein